MGCTYTMYYSYFDVRGVLSDIFGTKWYGRIPVTIVSSHVNLSAFDHFEIASDINRFPGCFLALCAKALIKAD